MNSPLKILVVEDEEAWQDDVKDAIHSFWDPRADVDVVDGTQAARALLDEKTYDLAIVDLSLSGPANQPGSDTEGLELIKQIREHPHNQNCAVVIHTGHDKASVMLRAQKVLGANDYLVKVEDKDDFDEEAFVEKLKIVLGELLPRDGHRPTVFVSYARENADFAQRLVADMESAGYACWIDTRDITGGSDAIKAIAKNIADSDVLVVIVTRMALEREWVQDEILWARKKNKIIIPLILENVSDETGFFPLNRYQPVSFDGDYAPALSRLLGSLMFLSHPKI